MYLNGYHGMVVINFLNIKALNDNAYYEFLRSAVSYNRRVKADIYYHRDDSKRCICSEILLKYSIFKAFDYYGEFNIGYNIYGKPFLKNPRGFCYNISHAGEWVVLAYNSTEIGLDIEYIQPNNIDGIDYFFTKCEKDYINSSIGVDRDKRVTQIWTMKESYIKYLGTGLSTNLCSFSVNALNGNLFNCYGEQINDVRLVSFIFDMNYYVSVCMNNSAPCLKSHIAASSDELYKDNVLLNEVMIVDVIEMLTNN